MSFLKSHLGMARWHCVWLIPEFFTYPKVNHFPPDISFTMETYIRNTWKHQPFQTHTLVQTNETHQTWQQHSKRRLIVRSDLPRSPIFFRSNMAQ